MVDKNFALKDMFNRETVQTLAQAVKTEYQEFPIKKFIGRVFDENWEGLALKQRVRQITIALGELLPEDYPQSLKILKRSLPHLEDQGFEKMVFPDYVEVYGLDDWDHSINALEVFTQFVSGEFAIRPFIDRYPDETLAIMHEWAHHSHPGVRRLASEGCRPRLPWGMRLSKLVDDPAPILPILEILKDDEREEIRRSVANNLNDISKDNPEFVLKIMKKWRDPRNEERSKLINHALRTLVKSGHPQALELLGFSSNPEIEVHNIKVEPEQIELGEDVLFSFEILSTSDHEQHLIVDYLVHFLKANGKHTPKVFKLSNKILKPTERIKITRKHGIKPITTRKYYPGVQFFQPQINGHVFGKVKVELNITE
jgi:3-methyladenine DNA glycosylase AlkC